MMINKSAVTALCIVYMVYTEFITFYFNYKRDSCQSA